MADKEARVRPAYETAYAEFDLAEAFSRLDGSVDALNACVECCDRHVGSDRVAVRCVALDETVTQYTFEQLRELSAKAANVFADLGVVAGDVVAGLLPRTIELFATVLGAWRLGAVYQPMFTAFGPAAIEQRLNTSGAKLLVTNSANRFKLDEVKNCPKVMVVRAEDSVLNESDVDFHVALNAAGSERAPVMRRGDDLFILMSTSGTTGLPKGVPVPLRALPSFEAYLWYAVGVRRGDVYWNFADPGWAYGLYYAVTAPLLMGIATTFFEGAFAVDSMYRIIKKLGVTHLVGAPTAYRMLIAAGPEAASEIKGQLIAVSSGGEPLNPEVIRWFDAHLDVTIHDHYGQTETGMLVHNHHGLDQPVRIGSAGRAMPGYRVAVLDDEGRELGANQPGVLAVDIARSPLLWFKGYHNKPTPAIDGGYYRTGDTAELETDGSISFVGRADDVITSAGYRIGPYDVESALIEHPAVVEAAVIGVPDPERTEIVKAFVVLGKGYEASDALGEALSQHVKQRLSAHAYPRIVVFVTELPKTPSGKIQRFMLRQAESTSSAKQ